MGFRVYLVTGVMGLRMKVIADCSRLSKSKDHPGRRTKRSFGGSRGTKNFNNGDS